MTGCCSNERLAPSHCGIDHPQHRRDAHHQHYLHHHQHRWHRKTKTTTFQCTSTWIGIRAVEREEMLGELLVVGGGVRRRGYESMALTTNTTNTTITPHRHRGHRTTKTKTTTDHVRWPVFVPQTMSNDGQLMFWFRCREEQKIKTELFSTQVIVFQHGRGGADIVEQKQRKDEHRPVW